MPTIVLCNAARARELAGMNGSAFYAAQRAGEMPPAVKRGRGALYVEHELLALTSARAAGWPGDKLRSLVDALVKRRAIGDDPEAFAAEALERFGRSSEEVATERPRRRRAEPQATTSM